MLQCAAQWLGDVVAGKLKGGVWRIADGNEAHHVVQECWQLGKHLGAAAIETHGYAKTREQYQHQQYQG